MGKRILRIVGFSLLYSVVNYVVNSFMGIENALDRALLTIIPVGFGVFLEQVFGKK